MSPLSATAVNCAGPPSAVATLARMQAEREQLTGLLRSLAADFDGVDRRLAGIMNARLHGLAGQLNDLDAALSGLHGDRQWPPATVGTCPDCGYPSLGSGLCAPCRTVATR